jgi:hypothetical protein
VFLAASIGTLTLSGCFLDRPFVRDYKDKETGVHYLIFGSHGITVRYDSNGEIMKD